MCELIAGVSGGLQSTASHFTRRRRSRCRVLIAGLGLVVAASAAGEQVRKPATASHELPEGKQTTLGLYVTASEAYEMWKAAPDNVKIIDVRTPEEFVLIGHAEMAWNIPIGFITYQREDGILEHGSRMNSDFLSEVKKIAAPTDTLLLMCRSGGRSAMAVNQLAAAGFKNAYNITDGMEGDKVKDPESIYLGKRKVNGWKNRGLPWIYGIDPTKILIEEGTSK